MFKDNCATHQLRQEDSEKLPEDMTQRQKIEEPHRMKPALVFQIFADLTLKRSHIRQYIAMTDHDAFGLRRSPRRKYNFEGILRADLNRGRRFRWMMGKRLLQFF